MNEFLKNTKDEWETLAILDPLWAILGESNKRFGKWKLNKFFATGEKEIASVISYLREKKVVLKKINTVLDFGCGVGRATRALSRYFPHVYGVDISETMIKRAKKLNADYRCRFIVNSKDYTSIFPDGHFDLIYSNNVLQPFPNKETAVKQITDFIRILKPSGIALFQFPSRLPFLNKLHFRRRLYGLLKNSGFSENFLYTKLHLYGFSMLSLSIREISTVLDNKADIIDIKDEGSIYTTYLVKKSSIAML